MKVMVTNKAQFGQLAPEPKRAFWNSDSFFSSEFWWRLSVER